MTKRLVATEPEILARFAQQPPDAETIRQWFGYWEAVGRRYGECLEDLNRRCISLQAEVDALKKAQP